MSEAPSSVSSNAGEKTKAKKPAASKPAAHPKYEEMVKSAIITLKDRQGSSRQAIKKFVAANFKNLGDHYDIQITAAIKRGVEKGIFSFPKGPSGPVKLTKPTAGEKKPKTTKNKSDGVSEAKPKSTKAVKPKDTKSAKKAPAVKKAPAAKKASKENSAKKKVAANKGRAPKKAPAASTA